MPIRPELPRLILSAIFLAAVCASNSPSPAAEPSWPRLHGPDGTNISTETGLLKKWPEQGPKLLWTATGIGHGFATVAIAGGLIYTAGDRDERCTITAMDLGGRIRWQVDNGPAWTGSVPGARATPTIDGNRLYHQNAHGDVVCLDAATGRKIWGMNMAQQFGGRSGGWGYAESLLVDGPRLICSPGGDTAMAALDKNTGRPVWKSPSAGDPAGHASPILAEYRGLRMLLSMSQKALIGVNADTGDLLWRYEHYTPRYVANCVTPIYHDGRVFVTGGYEKGSALLEIHVDGRKATVEPVWKTKDLDNRHGGVVLVDGHVYGACHATHTGRWACLDWKTGRLSYAERGVGTGSLTCADGMLYTLSEHRKVGLVRPTPSGYALLSQFQIPEGGKGPTWAHPVVCAGRLYIRHADRLYAYAVRAE